MDGLTLTEAKQKLIGLTVSAAKGIHRDIRVVKEDGEARVVTMDYRPDRINVEVRDDLIVDVKNFG